uniref:Uncharacterized protein n=1 Tax=Octopus bimaculoides TaxID=37653 RepID=A0A0L8HE29_OCTBM
MLDRLWLSWSQWSRNWMYIGNIWVRVVGVCNRRCLSNDSNCLCISDFAAVGWDLHSIWSVNIQ